MPPEIAKLYLDFDWDKRKVWALNIQPVNIDRSLLDWHLDLVLSENPIELKMTDSAWLATG